MGHILGNKVLQYDGDDRWVVVDERDIDRTVNPKPNIADWVKEHMVFWYDMSKPVDTYIPSVTYANIFVNGGGKLTYDNAINKCIITHTPTNNNNIAFLLNKKQIITIVNNDVTGDKTKTPIFFSNTDHNSGWISSAFYNSFGFDSVPTKETDGFTEQDLINYVLENLITKWDTL